MNGLTVERCSRRISIQLVPAAFVVLWLAGIAVFEIASSRVNPDATLCLLRNATGIPCAACGGSRAAMALGRGDVAAAFLFNPLLMTVGTVAAGLLALRLTFGRAVYIRGPLARRVMWCLLGAAFVANWAWVLEYHRG